jgi:hypothetical protein
MEHLLEATSDIKAFHLGWIPRPALSKGSEEALLVPGFEMNAENFLGVFEGWDSKHRTLHYVAAAKEWDSAERWKLWTDLLRSRGLLAAHWDEIDEGWLRARSRALLPERFRFPDGLTPPSQAIDDVWLCVEADGRVAARDPSGTMALLCAGTRDRIVFAVTQDDPAWSLPPHQALTCLMGAQPDLNELPAGHPLELLVSRVALVFPQYGVARIPLWETLESDFVGLRVIRVDRSSEDEPGVVLDVALLREIRSALLSQSSGASSSLKPDAPEPPFNWDAAFREARLSSLPGSSSIFEDRLDALLAEFIPERSGPETPDSIISICRSAGTAQEPWRSVLLDLGLLASDPAGRLQFTDPAVRARLFARAVALAPDRQATRLLSEPPGEAEEPIADVIAQTIKSRRIRPAPSSQGEAMVIAREAVLGQAPWGALAERRPNIATLWKACACLVRWRRPDVVASLALQFGNEASLPGDPELEFEIGSGIRRHGTPKSAADFFETAVTRAEGTNSYRLQQQLAGVLRDRGGPGDRERAEQLYSGLLKQDDLGDELRLHTTCGAAENLYLMDRVPEAIRLLEKTLVSSSHEAPRLKALVEHRLAVAKSRAGLHAEALELSRSAIASLEGRLQGSFASRVLDSHARFLATAGLESEARATLQSSISIKRASGDRRGLQISFLFLSALLQREEPAAARVAATEALELADAAGDTLGAETARRRLQVLDRHDRADSSTRLNEDVVR